MGAAMRLSLGMLMRVTFRMPVSFSVVAIAGLAAGFGVAAMGRAQAAQGPSGAAGAGARTVPAEDNPVADPKAVVTVGHARCTAMHGSRC